MSAHQFNGAVKEAVGGLQQAAGALIGDKKVELQGAGRRLGGRAERRYGDLIDQVRDLVSERPVVAGAAAALLAVLAGVVVARKAA